MRKKTVRSGVKFMVAGVLFVTIATFFPAEVSSLFFLGIGGEVRVTFLGFFLGGVCGGCGVLVAAAGLLQGGGDEKEVRLAPSVLLLISLVVIFFVLAYNALNIPGPRSLPRGESIDI